MSGAVQIPAATRLGPVHLTVADLDASIVYYERVLGLKVRERAGSTARLGAGRRDLLVLVGEPGAPPADGYCGLYHFALLVPERVDLARWLAHAARERVALVGAADHFVSEAIYLSDPDHHGIEIYWDRPRSHWEGKVARGITTLPLDVDDLLAELGDPATAAFGGLPELTSIGHIHLRVASIPKSVAFYRDLLGFDLMAELGPQAALLGAGGYHHHIGANTWESAGRPPAPAGSATLRQATIVVPRGEDRDRLAAGLSGAGLDPVSQAGGVLVRDPSGNAVLLTADSGAVG